MFNDYRASVWDDEKILAIAVMVTHVHVLMSLNCMLKNGLNDTFKNMYFMAIPWQSSG